jgi:hypothetical protein
MNEGELRAMVRDLLRDALSRSGHGKAAGAAARTRQVSLATDKDVADFVTLLVGMIDNPATGKAVRNGDITFTMAGSAQAAMPAARDTAQPAIVPAARLSENNTSTLGGIVTEARINKLAGPGTILLSPDAVITPLARDRARSLGLKFERKR